MQRQQHQVMKQNMHSSDAYQARQPDSALFEDSPKSRPATIYYQDGRFPRSNMLLHSEESRHSHEGRKETGNDSDDNAEGEGDIEYIIMNLYSKMKNLENKYIDLANFYKQELVRSASKKKLKGNDSVPYGGGQMRSSAISPSHSFERSNERDSEHSPGKNEIPQEQEIIQNLIEEKQRLEDDMKQIMTLRNNSQFHSAIQQQSPLKKHLNYDYLGQGSNPQHFKEAISKQKLGLQSKKPSIRPIENHKSEDDHLMQQSFIEIQAANNKFLNDMEKEMTQFRRKSDYFQMNIQKLKSSLRHRESYVRDDQMQLQNVINDMYKTIQKLTLKEQLLLSGEKGQNPNALSPFEKRLVNYQKSAEMRKEGNSNPLNRSGSRGRAGIPSSTNIGANYYRGDYNSNQGATMGYTSNIESDQDCQVLKSKFKHFQRAFEEYNIKIDVILQEEQDLNKFNDDSFSDQSRFLKIVDNLIIQYSNKNSMPTSQIRNDHQSQFPMSPLYKHSQKLDSGTGYNQPPSRSTYHEQKLADLQRHNDQLFQQLRQANEKYLDGRVEANKLNGEIKQLQKMLDDTKLQLRKNQQEQPLLKSQTRKHSQQRNDPTQPGTRQQSYNSVNIQRENEDLKKRIQELEKECLALNYYNHDIQRASAINSDPYIRQLQQENQDIKSNFGQITLIVQEFLMSMRKLQRAVNHKDKDIAVYKSDFERVKKSLERFIQDSKEQQENKGSQGQQKLTQGRQNSSMIGFGRELNNHHSMIISEEFRQGRFGQEDPIIGQRNKSQAPLTGPLHKSGKILQPPMYPTSQRSDLSAMNLHQQSNFKKGVIKPKHNNYIQSPSPNVETNEGPSRFDEQQSPTQQQKFNRLLDEIRQTEELVDRQKHQIEDLKSVNEMLLAEKSATELKYNNKSLNNQQLSQQLKLANERVQQHEKLIDEYKNALCYLEQVQNLNKLAVSKMKTELMIREREIFNRNSREVSQQSPSKFQNQDSTRSLSLIKQLREELIGQINKKQKDFESVIDEINNQLQTKESDLCRVKTLFVNKLRELESSFNEISQEMVDSEQIQQETSKRYQVQLTKQQSQQQKSDLEKSLEDVIGRADNDQREEELQNLIDANKELLEQNSSLRQQLKIIEQEGFKSQDNLLVIEKLEILKEDNEELEQQVKSLREDEYNVQKQLDQLKQDYKKLQSQCQEIMKDKEQTLQIFQQQQNEYENQLQSSINTLQQEQEQRVLFQQQSNNKEKQLKILRNDKQALQNENEKLTQVESQLLQQVEQLKQECEYMSQLRQDKNNDNYNDQQENEESLFNDQQEDDKIIQNPIEAAKSYYRMLKVTKKEYQILNKAHDKIQDKYQELKNELKEMRQEARVDAENSINREARLFDLENSNLRLKQELEKTKGQNGIEESAIREQIEVQFRQQLDFKETEVVSMTEQLARITQTNSEMTTKILRLETNIDELSTENEQMKHKMSSLEMELEMTKSNSERDTEQLMEQQQQREEIQKAKLESERTNEQNIVTQKLQEIENQRIQLQQKLAKKKEKLKTVQAGQKQSAMAEKIMESLKSSLEMKLQVIQKELEVEKQARLESEKMIIEQERVQEEERAQLLEDQEKERIKVINQFQQQLQSEKKQYQQQIDQHKLLEEQLMQKHYQEKQLLEQRLKEEREFQESKLLESEREKIERVRKEFLEEKEIQMKNFEESKNKQADERIEQLRISLEQEKQEEIKKLQNKNDSDQQIQQEVIQNLEKNMQNTLYQIEQENSQNDLIKRQLQHEKLDAIQQLQDNILALQSETQKKLKASKLVQVLQKHARETLIKELNNQKAILISKEEENCTQLEKQTLQFQQEVQQLKELNEKELNMIRQKLEAEKEDFKQEKKMLKLVQVLQMKARESLLHQLQNERMVQNQQVEKITSQHLMQVNEKEEAVKLIKEEYQAKLSQLERQFDIQNQNANQKIKSLQLAQGMLLLARKSILSDFMKQEQDRIHQQMIDQEKIAVLNQDHEKVLLQMNQVKISQLELMEHRLQQESEVAQRDKKINLLIKVLLQKSRQSLLYDLEQEKRERNNDQIQTQSRILEIQKDYDEKMAKALSEQQEKENKINNLILQNQEKQKALKQIHLVYSLQIQSRNALLKQIEEQKTQKQKQLELKDQLQQRSNDQLKSIQDQYQQQVDSLITQQQQMEKDYQLEKDQILAENQQIVNHLNSELAKVRKEQEDLVKSLSQQQDQQTKDLLAQKDNEARHMVAELALQHQKELQEKEKQNKLMQTLNDKIKKDMEEKLKQSIQEKEELMTNMEQDMQLLNQDQEEQLEALKQQSQENLNNVKDIYLKEKQQKQTELDDMQVQLETLKEQQRLVQLKISEDKEKEIKQLKLEILELKNKNSLLQLSLDEQQNLVQQLQDENKASEVEFINFKKLCENERTKLISDQDNEIKKLVTLHEKNNDEIKNLNQQNLELLKQRLDDDMQEQLKKHNSEKSLLEIMQIKIRDELQQNQATQQEYKAKLDQLQIDIKSRESQQQIERLSQQEHIDNLNQQILELNSNQNELIQANKKLILQLDQLKKNQTESDNSQLKDLREKLEILENQNDKLQNEQKQKENEINEIKAKLKKSDQNVENLEKDMDQFVKEMEEERTQNDSNKEKIAEELNKALQQFDIKCNELNELVAISQSDKVKIQQLEDLQQQMKIDYDKELEDIKSEYLKLKEDQNKANHASGVLNESIDMIESKLQNFDIELGKVKQLEKIIEQQQQLQSSLINDAQNDNDQQIMSQMGDSQDTLKYIKRVKYQEKCWILIQQNQNYYWIDQDKIPVQKLQALHIDQVEDLSERLQDQLKSLQEEKENILKHISDRRDSKQHLSQQNDNISLKQELSDLKLANNTLQQNNLSLKQRINELNEMIFGLADTDKDHENMKKIVELHKKSEDLIKKLRLQIEETKKFESEVDEKQQEIDSLKKQLSNQEYSFAKAGGKSFVQGNKPENFNLDASSIGKDPDEESFNHINVEVVSEPVQLKVQRLEQELEEYQRLQKDLEDSNRTLQGELNEVKASATSTQNTQNNEVEMQDHLKHTRSILIKFLEKVPITSKENEDLLPIVYSMMLFTKEEMNSLMAIRQAVVDKLTKEQVKKGVFGMFGGPKKDKK